MTEQSAASQVISALAKLLDENTPYTTEQNRNKSDMLSEELDTSLHLFWAGADVERITGCSEDRVKSLIKIDCWSRQQEHISIQEQCLQMISDVASIINQNYDLDDMVENMEVKAISDVEVIGAALGAVGIDVMITYYCEGNNWNKLVIL